MNIFSALYCETIKVLRSLVFWLSFVLFAISLAILSFRFEQISWAVFFDGYFTFAANAGLLVNFFIAAWIFGREFTDKTNKDLVAKPMSRITVVLSKFMIIFLWGLLFMVFLLLFCLVAGSLLGFSGFSLALVLETLPKFIATFLLYIIVSTPGAFSASVSKGILAPIGILFVLALTSNVLNDTTAAAYFPWTIPNVFRETGRLNPVSIVILISTGIAGIAGTFAWWRFAEQE
jgi:ABC-2 type transport system permease protein